MSVVYYYRQGVEQERPAEWFRNEFPGLRYRGNGRWTIPKATIYKLFRQALGTTRPEADNLLINLRISGALLK